MKKVNPLVEEALKVKAKAYVPYSHFHVGAALKIDSGEIITGCNIENASYGATICAERVAIFKAVAEGKNHIDEIAIASDSDDLTFPCGICRQVMAEFNPKMKIVVANKHGDSSVFMLNEIFPHAFEGKNIID